MNPLRWYEYEPVPWGEPQIAREIVIYATVDGVDPWRPIPSLWPEDVIHEMMQKASERRTDGGSRSDNHKHLGPPHIAGA